MLHAHVGSEALLEFLQSFSVHKPARINYIKHYPPNLVIDVDLRQGNTPRLRLFHRREVFRLSATYVYGPVEPSYPQNQLSERFEFSPRRIENAAELPLI